MPQTLTDDPSSFPVSVTAPADGDLATGSIFIASAQSLANRTAYLNQQQVQGVKKVRTVTDLTALRSIIGMANGETAIVDQYGQYKYDAAATGSQVYQPGASFSRRPTGSWRWRTTPQRWMVGR